jgi:hypothetical protein
MLALAADCGIATNTESNDNCRCIVAPVCDGAQGEVLHEQQQKLGISTTLVLRGIRGALNIKILGL